MPVTSVHTNGPRHVALNYTWDQRALSHDLKKIFHWKKESFTLALYGIHTFIVFPPSQTPRVLVNRAFFCCQMSCLSLSQSFNAFSRGWPIAVTPFYWSFDKMKKYKYHRGPFPFPFWKLTGRSSSSLALLPFNISEHLVFQHLSVFFNISPSTFVNNHG